MIKKRISSNIVWVNWSVHLVRLGASKKWNLCYTCILSEFLYFVKSYSKEKIMMCCIIHRTSHFSDKKRGHLDWYYPLKSWQLNVFSLRRKNKCNMFPVINYGKLKIILKTQAAHIFFKKLNALLMFPTISHMLYITYFWGQGDS